MKKFLILIFACGIILRIVFLCVGLKYVPVGSDEAILGLMAKRILSGEFPLITWVQPHGGTLEAYLNAPLYLLFGAGKLTVRLLPFIFSSLFLVMGFFLGREYFGEKAGLITASLIAVPPVYLSILGSLGVSMNFPALLGSSAIIYIAHRVIYGDLTSSKKLRLTIVMGVVGGITFWVHPIVICALVSAAIFILINDRPFIRKGLWVFALSFVIGSAPLWLYNFSEGFATFKMIHPVGMQEALTKLKTGLTFTLPAAWGILRLPTYIDSSYFIRISSKLSIPYAVLCVGLILVAIIDNLRGRSRHRGLWLLLFFLAMDMALFSKNSRSSSTATRYLAPTFIALMPVISVGLLRLTEKSKAFFLILCFIIGFNLVGNIMVLRNWASESAQKRLSLPDNDGLISFFGEKNIRYGYAHYWLSYPIVFKTDEAVLISPAYDERFGRYTHPYLKEVQSAECPAYIFHSDIGLNADWFERELLRIGAEYKVKNIDSFTVFYDFESPAGGMKRIEKSGFRLSSNHNTDGLPFAVDGNNATRWGTASPQSPGMDFTIDMGNTTEICGILLHLGDFQHDFPRALKVYVSCDGEIWEMVWNNPRVGGGLYWDGNNPRIYTSEKYIKAVFKPVDARWIRLIQSGYARMDWSITEFEVLGVEKK